MNGITRWNKDEYVKEWSTWYSHDLRSDLCLRMMSIRIIKKFIDTNDFNENRRFNNNDSVEELMVTFELMSLDAIGLIMTFRDLEVIDHYSRGWEYTIANGRLNQDLEKARALRGLWKRLWFNCEKELRVTMLNIGK